MDLAGIKTERNDILAVFVVFLLALGVWQFPLKTTLPDFSAANNMKEALLGGKAPLHIAIAAAIEPAYAKLFGMEPSSPQAIVSFLLVFPPLLLAITSVLLYAAVRALGIKKSVAGFSAVLFTLSLSSLAFLPGVYSAGSIAAVLFSLFLLLFAIFISKKGMPSLAGAALLALASTYFSPEFGFAGILASLCYAAGAYGREKERVLPFVLIAALSASGILLSPDFASLSFSSRGVSNAFLLMPFLIAAASSAAVLFFFSALGAEWLLFLAAGIVAAGFSPLAGAMLLVFPSAQGMLAASSEKPSKPARLACALFLAFFAIFGLAYFASDAYKAMLVAALLSPTFPLLLHFYGYRNQQLFFAMGLGLFSLALFTTIFYQFPPQKEFFPKYVDSDLSQALSYLSGKDVRQLGLSGRTDAAGFYLSSASVIGEKEFSSYFHTGKPVPPSGSYLLFSLSQLDSQGQRGFEAYYFIANVSDGRGSYALFTSGSGRIVARALDSKGGFLLADGTLLDSYGQPPYASIPLSRMLMLSPGKAFSDQQNRLIVLEAGAPLPYFMKIYSGAAGELSEVSQFGSVSVYAVK